MTATDDLRRLLDERGVEHYDGTECTLWGHEDYDEFTGIYHFSADETKDGYMQVRLWHVTPEQAIDATLGRGECRIEPVYFESDNKVALTGYRCHSCGAAQVTDGGAAGLISRWRYCPNCGRRVTN